MKSESGNNIAEKNFNEIERLTKKNKCQKQDIDQMQLNNKILEEHIFKNNTRENNEGNNQTRAKENGKKNIQNKGKKTLKENGINIRIVN